MTNNEKINAMSVEEKAEFFKNICSQIAIYAGDRYVVRDKKLIVDWLNSDDEYIRAVTVADIEAMPSADVVEVDETEKRTIAKYLDIITNEKQCVLIASQNQCDRNCANCQLLRNTSDILETYDYVLKMLKNVQELKKDINVLNKEVTK